MKAGNISYRSLRDGNRGGGLYTDAVSQRIGSLVGASLPAGTHPTLVTLVDLVIGVASGTLAVAAVDVRPTWLIGTLVLVGWQVAFALDCTDGQLARALGKTSAAGARVDILCDFAVQSTVVAAVVIAVIHQRHAILVPVLFATTWFVNLIVAIVSKVADGDCHSLLRSSGPLTQVVKLARDYGLLILLLGLAYAFWRPALFWLITAILVVNVLFMIASIANEARLSMTREAHGRP